MTACRVLLITPPFTQLNTPYPATMYLKGYLNTLGVSSRQADLGIEVIHTLFSRQQLQDIFASCASSYDDMDANLRRIYLLSEEYCNTIDGVMAFLQGKNNTLAYQINDRKYLPEAGRFEHLADLDYGYGQMGITDKARHLATLYLEDIGDLITACVDPHFGFNRYAESLARTATSFSPLMEAIEGKDTIISTITLNKLEKHLALSQPQLMCITVPFPGNLYGGLKCAQYVKKNYPDIKIVMGGGYVNTELRSIRDERFFDYVDFLSLDDGEAPLMTLLQYLDDQRPAHQLKRMFYKSNGVVVKANGATEKDIHQSATGTPDYSDLFLDQYLSILEVNNAMHRLWSDGRWNKLTLAHGCYWGKCSFCDIGLDYIGRYEPIHASLLCDRIEAIVQQTGQNGFHFVDEAAPPALMGELALELIKRKIDITWWTNIRFEKSFTEDLCKLLRSSGCVAVSGGLEVASDRLLTLMKKGVTVAQVARVADNFTRSGILVHAYLMYGFPTQTNEETIDSLEVVRQLFETGTIQSAFWHRFAMTAHSPVGLAPADFQVTHTGPDFEGFAENDYFHDDPKGGDHDAFSQGLKLSLYNYMNGLGFDLPLQHWFDHKVPKSTHKKNLLSSYLNQRDELFRSNAKVYFLGNMPIVEDISEDGYYTLHFFNRSNDIQLELEKEEALWLMETMPHVLVNKGEGIMLSDFCASYAHTFGEGDGIFHQSEFFMQLRQIGLIVI